MSKVYIALLDRDAFISQGLMFFFAEYFRKKNKTVEFVSQTHINIADIIFYDASYPTAYLIGNALGSGMKDCVVISLCERRNTPDTWRLGRLQKVLPKRSDLEKLHFYLDELWNRRDVSGVDRLRAFGNEELSTRQRQIMRLLAKGVTPAEISMQLNISIKTVSSHRGAVMKKFGFNRKIELYNWLILCGNEL
ncbi:response regulator transcription factor [Serratia surfactantfaciens]|uniref:Helix-turn-helix transcriptional regulator n=1 Tax=Serratia surfactantfaciens TaxID=2741499 RepID=A0ABS0M463_9GAMM|nr:helix-turn-helix transcriptional regulator [Serratia surfactantfaciens]MBH1922375.1 helix-turn-helix transcriptional regulator [Serratia surfactantfaciens]